MPGNPGRRRETAERILEDAQRRVEEQTRVVQELKADGRSPMLAERLLETYRDVLTALRN